MDRDIINARLAEIHRGPWIIATDVAIGATGLVEKFLAWGNDDLLVVAAAEGAGSLPSVKQILYTRTSGPSIMLGLRAYLASIESPTPEITSKRKSGNWPRWSGHGHFACFT